MFLYSIDFFCPLVHPKKTDKMAMFKVKTICTFPIPFKVQNV